MSNWTEPKEFRKSEFTRRLNDFDFLNRLYPDGTTVVSATLKAETWDEAMSLPGEDVTSSILQTETGIVIDGRYVRYLVKDGSERQQYKITCQAILSSGGREELYTIMRVRD